MTRAQIDAVYDQQISQLRLRIEGEYGTLVNFSKKTGINRTSLSKWFSDEIRQDMSVESYLRISHALGIIKGDGSEYQNMYTGIRLRSYLVIPNNVVMNCMVVVANDL